MEFLRRFVCFMIGFVAAASVVILDDRMSLNYGYHSELDLNQEIRQVISAFHTLDFGENDQVEERPSLEVFVTQKI